MTSRGENSLTWEIGDKSYTVYFDVSGRWTKPTFHDPGDSPEVDITTVVDDAANKEIPRSEWAAAGFDRSVLDEITERALEIFKDAAPEYEPDDRTDRYDFEESSGNKPYKYRINRPGTQFHDLEFLVAYEIEPKFGGDAGTPVGNEVQIVGIARASDPSRQIPKDMWHMFGIDDNELDVMQDAIAYDVLDTPYRHEGMSRWGRLKGGYGEWEAGTEVEVVDVKRNSDGSKDVLIKGPDGKTVPIKLDQGEEFEKFIDILEKRTMADMTEEMRALAGLPVRQAPTTLITTEADRAVQKDWRRMAVNPSKNLVETSETTGGAIVPASFVFPDLGALLGYTQQKLPTTLLRCIDRMTPEGQNAMAVMLNELQKLRPAADHLVEVFAGIADGIDKFDGGSIEGREVARVFRYMMDAARFTQGGAELTEQL
jgi:hypothetical protein